MVCRFTTASNSILGTRKTQQDTAVVYEHKCGLLAAVCDGMGGLGGGELASKTAAATLKALYLKKHSTQSCADFFRASAEAMDEAVYNLTDANGDRLRAGTTVVAVIIEDGKLTWLSAGDSRLYILRGTEMIRATRDHNYFLQLDGLRAEGKLTDEQYAAEAPRGESLLSYLGMGGLEMLDINDPPLEVAPGDKILLSSDGLYRAVDDTKIQAIVSEYKPNGAVLALASLAKKNSPEALDNTTCIVIHCIGGEIE